MDEQDKRARFEELVMPHVDAAYNLACWLTRNEHDAQDIVQEACLRAFKFFEGFHGNNGRSWLLSIVRNAGYTWLEKRRKSELSTEFDEEVHGLDNLELDPLAPLLRHADQEMVREAVEKLPTEFREVVILRDLEEMSYKDIAEIAQIPIGTVMSRLARARKQLHGHLTERLSQERSL